VVAAAGFSCLAGAACVGTVGGGSVTPGSTAGVVVCPDAGRCTTWGRGLGGSGAISAGFGGAAATRGG